MSTQTLIIKELSRSVDQEPDEVLYFQQGVNVLAGTPNTGKTKWLNMLDYVLGDTGTPEDAFGAELTDKYSSIQAVIEIAGEEFHLKRTWKKYGTKGKVFVNGEPIDAEAFSNFLLDKLKIPILNYPKGSPFRGSWPALSWRVLFRHIYRQQRFWSDFADKQPEVEQHACLMLFLGIAEYLYSEEYGELVKKRKRIFQLEGSRDEFEKLLDEISKGLIDEKEVGVGITEESLNFAIRRLSAEIEAKRGERDLLLSNLLRESNIDSRAQEESTVETITAQWTDLQVNYQELDSQYKNAAKRSTDMVRYKDSLINEIAKLDRAATAGEILANIKLTNCPACDQPVNQLQNTEANICFLCHQPIANTTENESAIANRLKVEQSHLRAELQEIDQLIAKLSADKEDTLIKRRHVTEEIQRLENQLNTLRRTVAFIVSPDVTVVDMETGRIQERIRQLERIKGVLEYRSKLSSEIKAIQDEVNELEIQVDQLMNSIDFDEAGQLLSDGMTTYLNSLTANGRHLWGLERIRWRLSERGFEVRIGNNKWSAKLGGTLTLYFLIAYQYALLNLTNKPKCHYPGFVVLDLQPKLDDGTVIKDQENFIFEPFINLIRQPGMGNLQVIAAGAAFEGLEGANRIQLDRVWV